jgi:hypothetical protein
VKIALDAEGIPAAVLDEHSLGAHGLFRDMRVAVLNDDDLPRAQTVLARIQPGASPPPPSWRVQKRGLQLVGLGFVLMIVAGALLDTMELGPALYAVMAAPALAYIMGFVLIALGWRADKERPR